MKPMPFYEASIPQTSGCYVVRSGETVLYVGKAKNLLRRMNSHHKIGEVVRCHPDATLQIICCPVNDITKKEDELIELLNPLYEGHLGNLRLAVKQIELGFSNLPLENYRRYVSECEARQQALAD